MTCESSRREYIEAVQNVVEATHAASARRREYIGELRDVLDRVALQKYPEDLHQIDEAIVRLIQEERRARDDWESSAARHR